MSRHQGSLHPLKSPYFISQINGSALWEILIGFEHQVVFPQGWVCCSALVPPLEACPGHPLPFMPHLVPQFLPSSYATLSTYGVRPVVGNGERREMTERKYAALMKDSQLLVS